LKRFFLRITNLNLGKFFNSGLFYYFYLQRIKKRSTTL